MSWLDAAYQEKLARKRRARESRKEERRKLEERRQCIRTLNPMIRSNLGHLASRTWGRRFPWILKGFIIRSDRPSLGPYHTWYAFKRGETVPPCRVFEIYVLFNPNGDPIRLGVGHQRHGRAVNVYYARWQPWSQETESITEGTLRELLSVYFLRGPCLIPPEPPADTRYASR